MMSSVSRVVLLAVCQAALLTVALGITNNYLAGTWRNQLKSTLVLEADNNALSG